MAEALFQAKLMRDYPSLVYFTEASSAGTSAIEDSPATSSAVQAMDLWGIDLEPHRASVLTPSRLGEADLVLAMAGEHLLAIGRMEPGFLFLGKSTTLNHLASAAGEISIRLGDETVRSEKEARARVREILVLLRDLYPGEELLADVPSRGSDIIDPIGSSLRVYIGVAEEIDHSMDEVMRALFGRPETSPGRREEL